MEPRHDRPRPDGLKHRNAPFRTKPNEEIRLSMQARTPGPALVSGPTELRLQHDRVRGRDAYDRLIGDALRGDPGLFARQDGVMGAWRIVDGVLSDRSPAIRYERGSWGPTEADSLLGSDGAWATQ